MSDCPDFFGRTPEQFPGKISFIVTDLIKRLDEMKAETVEGIFRISGNAQDQQTLAYLFDEGRVTDWTPFKDVNVVSCVLKKYFRDNSETNPLFPFEEYDHVIDAGQCKSDDEAVARFKAIIEKFSNERRMTIAYIFKYINKIAAHEAKNKMNSNNLAIVFAPNIIIQKNPTMEQMRDEGIYGFARTSFIRIMELYDRIFEGVTFDDSLFMSNEDIVRMRPHPPGHTPAELQLKLKLIKAEGIPKMDLFSKSDPYVIAKVSSCPKTYVTKTIDNCHEPVWNESCSFPVHDRQNDVLKLKMFDEDTRNDELISTIEIPLDGLKKGTKVQQWFECVPAPEVAKGGRIFIEMTLEPTH